MHNPWFEKSSILDLKNLPITVQNYLFRIDHSNTYTVFGNRKTSLKPGLISAVRLMWPDFRAMNIA